jgi:hypothetical protein
MKKKRTPMYKDCICHTCNKSFHSLGIARHRAMHRDKKEDCTIYYEGVGRKIHWFSDKLCDICGDPAIYHYRFIEIGKSIHRCEEHNEN